MTAPRIQLLGDVAVVGGAGHLRSPGVRTVLALLAVHAGDSVDRDDLIDEVWGDHPPSDGTAALHVSVTRLRVRLGDVASVRSVGRRVSLEIERDRVDLTAFLDAADTVIRGGDPGARAEALALWQEPVLSDIHSPRLAAVRAHVEAQHRALVER